MTRIPAGLSEFWKLFRKNRQGQLGLAIILFFLAMAVFAPWIAPIDPNATSPSLFLTPPSAAHPFGTDTLGRDLFSRNVYGARISLLVGLAAGGLAIGLGLLAGIVSGYAGGLIDEAIMRVVDFFIIIPALVFAIIIAALLGPSEVNVIVVIGVLSWAPTARIIRAMVLSIKEWPFVESAKANNAGSLYIMFRHVLPNVTSVLYANAMLAVSSAIFTQAALVFLGVGDVTAISWGGIIREADQTGALIAGQWYYFVPPGLFIFALILGFILFGYSLEEIMNPRLRIIKA
ncbi:MAG TPA: ABC transporter permease [Thermoplasmata archaeon]|nr:ABC transporter permease [Thermoplasmata archaeon]